MRVIPINDSDWKDRFTYKKVVVADENVMKCKGVKFQIVKFLPHSSIKCHFHKKTHEIFYIRKGSGILILNGIPHRCVEDDIFLCEPNDTHEFINDTNSDFVILIFKSNEEEDDIYWKRDE